MSNNYTLFSSPRVVVTKPKDGTTPWYRTAMAAISSNKDLEVTFDFLGLNEPTFEVAGDLTADKNTGIITFSDLENDYYVRPFREEDGLWLSKFKISLPVEALMQKIDRIKRMNAMAIFPNGNQSMPQEETLTAISYPGGNGVVVGLNYNDGDASWTRIDGDWLMLNDLDESLVDADAIGTMIDPEKADEFIQLFDNEYVSLDEIQDYALKFEDTTAPSEQ